MPATEPATGTASEVGLADTHCHLSDEAFASDRTEVIERARAAGVTHIVAVGGGGPLPSSQDAAALAAQWPFIRATAGIHPHDASSYDDAVEDALTELLELPDVVAVGETGLDYHYQHSPPSVQRQALARHLALARARGLPVVLHCREAAADLRDVISAEAPQGIEGVVHCFTGSYEEARWYLDQGLLVSLTGIITFKNARELQDTVGRLPLDRLMVETDSPYLAPVPHRGRRNEPAHVSLVAHRLAELQRTSFERVVEATAANAARLFFK